MQKVFFLVLSMMLVGAAMAQQDNNSIIFKVELRFDTVGLEERFEVKYVLENADMLHFEPPSFDGFQLVAGPSTFNSMSMINGQVKRSIAYSYYLKPTGLGIFEIPSAKIETPEGYFETEALPIVVAENVEQRAPGSEQPLGFEFNFGENPMKDFFGEKSPFGGDFFNTDLFNMDGMQLPKMDDMMKGFGDLFNFDLQMPPNLGPRTPQKPKKQERTYKL